MNKPNYTALAVVSLVTVGAVLGIAAAMYYTRHQSEIGSYDGDSPLFI